MKLTSNQIGQISKYCHSHGITLTTYFDIICICALQETVFSVVKSLAIHTSSLVAINGRRYYSDEIKNFLYGTLVCGAPIILPTIENKLEAMQIFHQEMTNDINTKSHSNQLVTSLNMPMYGNISRIKLIRLVGDLH